ncbi:MAG: LptF/LptG family permease [Planctomycetes bacterium]|nr:LptF/LptG family permease [Planctomycetota bacterium]
MINKLLLSGPYSYIRKLDYYVLKAFLFALTISILALLGLYIVIHFFTNISDFIEITQQEVFIFIPRYYLIRLPIILYKLIPIMMLIAVMIAVSRLMKTRELIAMLSAGIGIHRIVLPIFIAVLFIIGIMYFVNEVVTPYLGKYLTITEKILKSEGSDRFLIRQARSAASSEGPASTYQFTIKKYDYVKQTMHSIWVNQYDPESNLMAQIIAERAEWTEKKLPGWMFYHGTFYSYDNTGRRKSLPRSFQGEGFLLSCDLTPRSIEKVEETSAYMNSRQLGNLITLQPNNRALQVQYYSKLTDPLIVLILIFLGLPFALARKNQNFFTGIGICLMASLGFFMVKFLFEGFGNKGIMPPLLAVTLPLIIFAALGIILARRIRT